MPAIDKRPVPPDDWGPRPGLQGAGMAAQAWHGTNPELLALFNAVRENFGPCACQVHTHPFTGQSCSGHPCEGHLFLAEQDEPGRCIEFTYQDGPRYLYGTLSNCVSRLDRLLFARHQRMRWMAGEKGYLLPAKPDDISLGW